MSYFIDCFPKFSKTALVAVFIFWISVGFSQNQTIVDSLSKINREDVSDSVGMEILRVLAINSTTPNEKIRHAEELLEISTAKNNIFYRQSAHNSLGTGYRLRGDLELSLFHLLESAKLAETGQLLKGLGETYSEIATVYSSSEDRENAVIYNKKAIDIFQASLDSIPLSLTLMNLGYIYYELKQLDSALHYYDLSEDLFVKLNIGIGKSYVLGNRALVKFEQGDFLTAEKEINEAISQLEPIGDNFGIADFQNQLGKVYIEIGEIEKATIAISKGISTAKKIDLKEQVRDASLMLSQLYLDLGDFQKAYEFQTQYIAFKDSIQNMETVQELANQRTEYEVGLKQAEVDLLEVRQENQRIFLIGLSVFLLVFLVGIIIVYRFYLIKKHLSQALESKKNELENLNHTKDKFFSIISHDLRSPVSAFLGISRMIEMLVKTKKTDELLQLTSEIDKSVNRLSSLLDNLLNWAMQQQGNIPNTPEKIVLSELIDDLVGTFYNMTISKNIEIINEIENDIILWVDKNSSATIFRNLINNAIKFSNDGGSIRVFAASDDSSSKITIEDNGVGMSKEKQENLFSLQTAKGSYGTRGEKGLGLGLQLVKEFVQLNQGNISVESEEGKGTAFHVTLPIYQSEYVLETD